MVVCSGAVCISVSVPQSRLRWRTDHVAENIRSSMRSPTKRYGLIGNGDYLVVWATPVAVFLKPDLTIAKVYSGSLQEFSNLVVTPRRLSGLSLAANLRPALKALLGSSS